MSLQHLSNEELISAIAGSAGPALIQRFGTLTGVARASIPELIQTPGVREETAKAILASFQLSARLSKETYSDRVFDTPDAAASILREEALTYGVEKFKVLHLTTRRHLIAIDEISSGVLDTCIVHPREVFAPAIARKAHAVILAHNHPGGDPSPSDPDTRITRELIRAGRLVRIEVLDHLILGQKGEQSPKGYCSLRELGHFSV